MIGYSGEDTPRSVIPSVVGHFEETQQNFDRDGDANMENKSASRYISGHDELNFKRDNMDIRPLY